MPYKDKVKKKEFQREWISKRRASYIGICGGCCVKCGSKDNLEFHHRDPGTKTEHKIWSWTPKRIEKELRKCDLLCRGCHHKETAKERGYYKAPHGTLSAYKDYGCRCKDCRSANAMYERNRRKERT